MEQYVGLDVPQKETAICVVDAEGRRVWQGMCPSSPVAIAETLRSRAPLAIKIAMETGPLAVWHWHELKAAGFPVICIHARHARAALTMQLNKTDSNDAHGLAQIVRTGWYRPVEIKSRESHKLLPAGKGGSFERLVLDGMADDNYIRLAIEPLLATWQHLTAELKKLNREIARAARAIAVCRRLMSVPGVGSITALAFITPWIGLTASATPKISGHIWA